jgi:hypothetical protein
MRRIGAGWETNEETRTLALVVVSSGSLHTTNVSASEGHTRVLRKPKITFGFVRFEVFTAVTMKNAVFLDVTPCGSCKNRRFGET